MSQIIWHSIYKLYNKLLTIKVNYIWLTFLLFCFSVFFIFYLFFYIVMLYIFGDKMFIMLSNKGYTSCNFCVLCGTKVGL